MSQNSSEHEEVPILSLIQRINDGTLNPKTLSIPVRQSCVEVLIGEGYTESQVAQILQRSEKTIQRDVGDIRDRNSLTPSVELAKKIAGEIFKKGLAHHDYLVRLSNGKVVSDADKIQARASAWHILNGLIERLQSLGFMPLKPKELVGDVYHHYEGGDVKTYEQLKQDLKDIERVSRDAGTLDPKIEEGIKLLEQRIEKAEISEQIADMNKSKDSDHNNREDGNGQQ